LQDEIDKYIKSDDDINSENLKKLVYTDYVFKETLRVLPPNVGSVNTFLGKFI